MIFCHLEIWKHPPGTDDRVATLCIPLGEVGQSGGGHKLLRGGVFIALDERSALLALGRSNCNSTRKHSHDGDRRVNNTGRQNLTVQLA
jgi:hypothetical protein